MKIYVGNLNWRTTDEELKRAFAAYGQVATATVIKDKATGRSRGFGFVEMTSDEEGNAAIAAMNGKELGGRTLQVNVARPQENRPPRPGGSGPRGPRPPRREPEEY